jgi:hypothetical protein
MRKPSGSLLKKALAEVRKKLSARLKLLEQLDIVIESLKSTEKALRNVIKFPSTPDPPLQRLLNQCNLHHLRQRERKS